jgi:hypothetical protein
MVNEDNTNYCTGCETRGQDVARLMLRASMSEELLEDGINKLEGGHVLEAETRFKECQDIYDRDLSLNHFNQLFLKESLSSCFEAKLMFVEAIKYQLQVIDLEKMVSGDKSLQVISQVLKLVTLLPQKAHRKELEDQIHCLSNARIRFKQCLQLLSTILSMEFTAATEGQLQVIPKLEEVGKILGFGDETHDLMTRLNI